MVKRQNYAPSLRLSEVRTLLHATGGCTIYEIAERLKVSTRTALRYLQALEDAGERLYEDSDGRRKIWRVVPSTREATFRLTTSQMVSLVLSRRVFDFLDGTGFKEDLDDVFQQLEATLPQKDCVSARPLDTKPHEPTAAPHPGGPHPERTPQDEGDHPDHPGRHERAEGEGEGVPRGPPPMVQAPALRREARCPTASWSLGASSGRRRSRAPGRRPPRWTARARTSPAPTRRTPR